MNWRMHRAKAGNHVFMSPMQSGSALSNMGDMANFIINPRGDFWFPWIEKHVEEGNHAPRLPSYGCIAESSLHSRSMVGGQVGERVILYVVGLYTFF